jgi:hypothetical protein
MVEVVESKLPPRTARPALRRGEPGRAWAWLPHLLVACLAIPFIVSQNAWFE